MTSVPDDNIDEVQPNQKKGVVYLSRIPPNMGPNKLRSMMCHFGDVGRIYLTPEDKTLSKQRKKETGKKVKLYKDGWVEFEKRKVARKVAEALNGTCIGGKKRHNWYRDDTWCIRYLPKFKWEMINEEKYYNWSVRKTRLDQAISQAKRENEEYLENVDRSKIRKKIEAKREKLGKKRIGENDEDQKEEQKRPRIETEQAMCSDSILSRIFG